MTYSVNSGAHLDWSFLCISFIHGALKKQYGSQQMSLENAQIMQHFPPIWAPTGAFCGAIEKRN